jgi:hypothetical protein
MADVGSGSDLHGGRAVPCATAGRYDAQPNEPRPVSCTLASTRHPMAQQCSNRSQRVVSLVGRRKKP